MEKRKSLKIYLSDEERKIIDEYAKRIGYKKSGELVRETVLRLARDESLDFIHDDGSLLSEDPLHVRLRQLLMTRIEPVIDLIIDNRLVITDIIQEEETDE